MEAIILAGGFGRRLKHVVGDVPKPMADIDGMPFLAYVMDYLSGQGVKKILLSVGYKYEVIKDYFGAGYKAMDIEYVIEKEPLGTGGAILESLRHAHEDNVICLNGDTLFMVDLKRLFEFHLSKSAILTLALKPMGNFTRYGSVIVENERVKGFREKSFKGSGYINGGIYAVNKDIMGFLEGYGRSFSFEVEFLEMDIENIRPFAFISNGYFIDIGVPEDYERAKSELCFILKGGSR
ncbi:MAG: nucleotidyltransferase family protein [Nitrospirae bacterium]|nr:nucleotidyltransferase family protein [Nitrospirota bacterium]